MADIFSAEKRSDIMSRIRSSGTSPERNLYLCVRKALGHRWRIHQNVRTLPGQPDIVVPGLHLAIFADGCFYHCCPLHSHKPKSNEAYWHPKLERTVSRDRANRKALRAQGFTVWRYWEHALKGRSTERTMRALQRRIQKLMTAMPDRAYTCVPWQ